MLALGQAAPAPDLNSASLYSICQPRFQNPQRYPIPRANRAACPPFHRHRRRTLMEPFQRTLPDFSDLKKIGWAG